MYPSIESRQPTSQSSSRLKRQQRIRLALWPTISPSETNRVRKIQAAQSMTPTLARWGKRARPTLQSQRCPSAETPGFLGQRKLRVQWARRKVLRMRPSVGLKMPLTLTWPLTMRLSDAGLRQRQTKALYSNHRLPPWLTEDSTPRSLEPIVRREPYH
jgi:hypothetical protein